MKLAFLAIAWTICCEVTPSNVLAFIDRASGNVYIATFKSEYSKHRERVLAECTANAARAEDCEPITASGADVHPTCVAGKWFVAPTGVWDGWVACEKDAESAREVLVRVAAGRKLHLSTKITNAFARRLLP